MPLYEYQCATCGRFEIIQKFSDQPLSVCPTCGQEVQKLLSAPAIQFKGTGWYITDYARKGGSGGSASGSTGDGDGGGKKAETSSPSNSTSKDSPASGSGSSS